MAIAENQVKMRKKIDSESVADGSQQGDDSACLRCILASVFMMTTQVFIRVVVVVVCVGNAKSNFNILLAACDVYVVWVAK